MLYEWGMPEATPQRKGLTLARVGCIVAAVLILTPVGGCFTLLMMGVQRGQADAKQNEKTAEPLIAALARHVKDKGTCPEKLDGLVPGWLPSVPLATSLDPAGQPFGYRCDPDGRFFVAFTDRSGVFLPSDFVYEYDSRDPGWTNRDVSEAETYRAQ